MKNFSYNKKESRIRTLKEPKIKKKKMNFDRVLYFIVIGIGLFFLVRHVYKKIAWIQGNGMVLMQKVDVNFTEDIRVKDIHVLAGDTVKQYEKLFNYTSNQFDNDASMQLNLITGGQSNQNEYLKYQQQIALKQNRLRNFRKQLAVIEKQLATHTKLVLLDALTKTSLLDIQNTKEQIVAQIQLLQGELALLRQFKGAIHKVNTQQLNSQNQVLKSTYRSPIDGIVGQLFKTSEESCYKTETVMTIHNPKEVYIDAYFKLEDLEYVKKGNQVKVVFPDKNISVGIIQTVYISTYEAPSEFQKKYEPTERNLLVKIVPQYNKDKELWKSFYKLEVELRIGKY